MPIWIYGVPPVPFITGICCRIEFLGAVGRMWDVWRSRIPQSHFKEAQISSPNSGSAPVVYLLALISWGRYLCVYASHTTDFISFHFIRLSYQTIIVSYFMQPKQQACHFLPTNHMVDVSYSLCRKSKKYFWHHNCKCSLLCFSDISENKLSSVMNGALIVFSMRGKTKRNFSSFSLLWTESSNQQKI